MILLLAVLGLGLGLVVVVVLLLLLLLLVFFLLPAVVFTWLGAKAEVVTPFANLADCAWHEMFTTGDEERAAIPCFLQRRPFDGARQLFGLASFCKVHGTKSRD